MTRKELFWGLVRILSPKIGKLLLMAIPFAMAILGLFALARATGNAIVAAVAIPLSLAVFAWYVGLTVGPVIGELMSRPLTALFFPEQSADRPPPIYGIPASKRAKGLYEEALHDYNAIAQEYPDELKPYTEMIDIAIVDLRDADRARLIFYSGCVNLTRAEDKEALRRHYEAAGTRLDPKPAWLKTEEQRTLTVPEHGNQPSVDEPDGLKERRFHAGGYGIRRGTNVSRAVDDRSKIPYRGKRPRSPASDTPPPP